MITLTVLVCWDRWLAGSVNTRREPIIQTNQDNEQNRPDNSYIEHGHRFQDYYIYSVWNVCWKRTRKHWWNTASFTTSAKHTWHWLVAWHSGRTSVFGRRTFPVLRSNVISRVTTHVGKPSATGQPTRPTQPFMWLILTTLSLISWLHRPAHSYTLREDQR